MNPSLQGLTLETLVGLDQDIIALDCISECAHSQKRVADDILGLAAIQLERYTYIPEQVSLAERLRTTLRIFANECKSKVSLECPVLSAPLAFSESDLVSPLQDIELGLVLGPSFDRLGTTKVMADPVRLSQILINLVRLCCACIKRRVLTRARNPL